MVDDSRYELKSGCWQQSLDQGRSKNGRDRMDRQFRSHYRQGPFGQPPLLVATGRHGAMAPRNSGDRGVRGSGDGMDRQFRGHCRHGHFGPPLLLVATGRHGALAPGNSGQCWVMPAPWERHDSYRPERVRARASAMETWAGSSTNPAAEGGCTSVVVLVVFMVVSLVRSHRLFSVYVRELARYLENRGEALERQTRCDRR